jgi:hypothetical protein
MTRRVWYGCVLMDTTLSMAYGRPTMIESHSATVLPLSLTLDEQYLPRDTLLEHVQPNTQPKTMAFYVQSLLPNKIPSRHITGLLQVFRHCQHRCI